MFNGCNALFDVIRWNNRLLRRLPKHNWTWKVIYIYMTNIIEDLFNSANRILESCK